MECYTKNLSHQEVTFKFRLNFSEPIDSLWGHTIFYYRYNSHSYQKFPIDLWENICGWLNKSSKLEFLLNWTSKIISKNGNLNHSCPYYESMEINAERIKLNNFLLIEQFLPSGQYRTDLNVSRSYKGESIGFGKFFFSISDNRVEKFWTMKHEIKLHKSKSMKNENYK